MFFLQPVRQNLQRLFFPAQQEMAQTRMLHPGQGLHQVRAAHAFGGLSSFREGSVELPYHRHSIRTNHVHLFQHGPITPVMHAKSHHVHVRGSHQIRSICLQGALRQGCAHVLHGTDGHGKAEYLSALTRYPYAGLDRVIGNSHGLIRVKGKFTAGTASARRRPASRSPEACRKESRNPCRGTCG